jgi:transposase-like protein
MKKRSFDIKKEWLINEYVTKERTTTELAIELQTSTTVITYHMKKHGIQTRPSPKKGKVYGSYSKTNVDKDDAVRLYVEERKPMSFIASKYSVSQPTIKRILEDLGIRIRGSNETKKGVSNHRLIKLDNESIIKRYSDEFVSIKDISASHGVSRSVIKRILDECGVKTRTISEHASLRFGALNPNYKSDISDETRLERRDPYKAKRWKMAIKDRDDNECQCCGSKNKIEVHHIMPFAFYPEKRYDIRNGVCLCDQCHTAYHGETKLVNVNEATLLLFVSES